MTEIRLRPKQVVILLAVFIAIIFIVASSSRNCPEVPQSLAQRYSIDLDLQKIYAITPTHSRPEQKAELTRLSQTLLLVPNLHWIIVEDADEKSAVVAGVLRRSGLNNRSTVIAAKTPQKFKLAGKDPNWIKPRGVKQRNAGLEWTRSHTSTEDMGVVFFMDDDNTYSLELFDEMLKIERGRVGVWPVGLVGGLKVEKPILNNNHVVTGFNSVWHPERPFPIDMAGFAISLDLLHKRPEAIFSYEVQRGYQESEILRHLTTVENLQPLANNCKEILVWHTRTEKPKLTEEEKLIKAGKRSDDGMEV